MFEHPIIAGIVRAIIDPIGVWLFNRVFRRDIYIMAVIEQGPTTREHGFTEPAVKITLTNKSSKNIQIKDIRLMFCAAYGVSIDPKVPEGRSHRQLPTCLVSGEDAHWYIPAEKLSDLLRSLHRPRGNAGTEPGTVTLYARCITGTNQACRGSAFPFSTDSNSHWP